MVPLDLRRKFLKNFSIVALSGAALFTTKAHAERTFPKQKEKHRFAFVVDVRKCIGCDACVSACKSERNTPLGVFNTWVEKTEVGLVDLATKNAKAKLLNIPKLCNHCESPACVKVCPTHATYRDETNGLVLQSYDKCIGCRLCEQSCPYGVRYIDPVMMVMNKCTWCDHRTTKGLKPACVDVCPTNARMFGDLSVENDPIKEVLDRNALQVLKQEEGTKPRVQYIGLETLEGSYIGTGSEAHLPPSIQKDELNGVIKTHNVRMQHHKFRENL